MFALVQDGSITKHLNSNRGLTIGDIQYPGDIFSKWTEAQRNAIGIFEVIQNNAKKKDEEYYINTNQIFTKWTQKQIDDGEAPAGADTDTVAVEGLKTIKIRSVKLQAAGILKDTDWYIVRKADAGTAVPSAITTYRAAVRTKCAEMETAITNASNTPAIETLYTYVNTADEGDPVVMERPLGEFPVLGY